MRPWGVWLVAACLACAAHAKPPQGRYAYFADGSEVTDHSTGLVWQRCVQGMVWSGTTCTGTARALSYEGALALASRSAKAAEPAAASTFNTGWRLPNVVELASLVERSRSPPSLDPTAFPANPAAQFWTSSPFVGYAYSARNEGGLFGHAVSYGDGYRMYTLLVRLVRVTNAL